MAIIGRGDIAQALQDREGFTFYANGISNRLPFSEESCNKEADEIKAIDNRGMFVYFSTLSIYYSTSPYTQHKLKMEQLVRDNFYNYCILRIGNINWGDNPNTLLNHLRKDTSRIDDDFRYLIGRDELNHWIERIPIKGKHEMNVPGMRLTVTEIARMIKEDNL